MRPALLLSAALLLLALSQPVAAQDHSGHPGAPLAASAKPDPHAGHNMPAAPADPHAGHAMPGAATDPHAGHNMPAAPADPHAGHVMPAAPADPHAGHVMPGAATDPHAGHNMPAAPADPHAGHVMPGATAVPDPHAGHKMPSAVTPVGNAAAPPAPTDHAADFVWGAGAMAAAREQLRREHGTTTYGTVMLGLVEARAAGPGRGYRWEGEAWYGGDQDGLTFKTEGEGDRESLESAEVQALYARAIGPYFNLQAGLRHDFRPAPSRTYGVLGVEGLAPYWFEVGAALFVSNKGDALARAEAHYDQLLTQRLILQPRIELNFAAQNVPATGVGSGLSSAELGLRLRYEFQREFAPYVGVSWERKIGNTARFARAAGERVGGTSLVIGIRAWF